MDRTQFAYASCYCEENVWQLAGDSRICGRAAHAVFISNPERVCPLWAQRSALEPTRPALWDYHVIYIVETDPSVLVYDLDTTLEVPCSPKRYLDCTFPGSSHIDRRFQPRFRVIESRAFRETFASDRSHMVNQDGHWKASPPPWPLIRTEKETMNLDRFIDMEAPFVGEVFELSDLIARFVRTGS